MMSGEVLSFQFDDVVIDLRAGRVVKGGEPVALEPKAYDLLVLLVTRAGALVSRQDVLDKVWAGVYVTDNAVARVVAQVRRGIGDSAREARYIETVPTRGYRFIGQVTPELAPPAPVVAAEPQVPLTPLDPLRPSPAAGGTFSSGADRPSGLGGRPGARCPAGALPRVAVAAGSGDHDRGGAAADPDHVVGGFGRLPGVVSRWRCHRVRQRSRRPLRTVRP
jgi:DNA-binding winged helix-turn-helix (wHTH) protein